VKNCDDSDFNRTLNKEERTMVNDKKHLFTKILALDMLMLCVAFSISIIGQMIEPIMNQYDLLLSQAGMLISVQSIGGLIVAIMSFVIVDSLNKKKVIVISGILMCVFLMSIGIKMPLSILFLVFIMLGLATAGANIISNAVMSETVINHPEKSINFMHTIFSLGAVTAPILSNYFYSNFGVSAVFFIMGGFAFLWSMYALFAFRKDVVQKLVKHEINPKTRLKEMMQVIKISGMKELGVIAYLATCWQLAAIYYVSMLFSGMTGNASDGALALSCLFLGMMVSRFLYSKVAHQLSPGRVLAIGCALASMVWISAMLTNVVLLKTILIAISGFICGNNFPIVFSTACRLSPKYTATALGVCFLSYYIALFTFIPFIGAVGQSIGLNSALKIVTIPLALVVPFALLLHKKMKPILEKQQQS
jgi:MFS transporter, FHS family, glucose/mannose:H+ symporter